jgi:hypothetical protein
MQMAMVLTPQKPIQRKRFGELPEGLPGSTLERGMRGEKRQELGRPVGFRLRGQPPQPVSKAEQNRGALKTPRESDPPILLRDGSAVHRGKGRTVLRSLHRKH